MNTRERSEACITNSNNVLLVLSSSGYGDLAANFCGKVTPVEDANSDVPDLSEKTVYLCGDLSKASLIDLRAARRVFVVGDLTKENNSGECDERWTMVDYGRVPISVHGIGVYYRRFFNASFDFFHMICSEHTFQSLTESTKPGKARRTGIYLTPVERDVEGLQFRLLRCSTNLSGPTENFRATDLMIVDALNQEAASIFQNAGALNHVLAQVYHNTPAAAEQKQLKATISAHADKTKDMPTNGIMAFCTFYENLDQLRPLASDRFDYGYKGTSALTRLRFRLKEEVDHGDGQLPDKFSITLYPNSVFFMPLSTNRLYTHEIVSSTLDASMLPTRLGYVVRCSSAEAVYKDNQTFLKQNGMLVPLAQPTIEGIEELRKLYAEENKTSRFVDYGDRFSFSMNQGDYCAPHYNPADEFRSYILHTPVNLFEQLRSSLTFEDLGKGRQAAVITKIDGSGRVPIVRTTTAYGGAAWAFGSLHSSLASQIQRDASLSVRFNNAMIEKYTTAYATMGSHSDQALDLEDNSFIALFSCYENPEIVESQRKLIVESKERKGETFEVPLVHNSVVVFSLAANRRFRHKIVLDTGGDVADNDWLGVTFRTSKTLVRFIGGAACFADGTRLLLADDNQRREFFELRRRENAEVNFQYPQLTYTISESDMLPPVL